MADSVDVLVGQVYRLAKNLDLRMTAIFGKDSEVQLEMDVLLLAVSRLREAIYPGVVVSLESEVPDTVTTVTPAEVVLAEAPDQAAEPETARE